MWKLCSQAGGSITFGVGGGPGRPPLHHLGNTFLKHAFWSPLLEDFLGFGFPLGSLRGFLGSTFLHSLFFCPERNKKHNAFGGLGRRGGACLSLQILQSLHTDFMTLCPPFAGVRRIWRLPPLPPSSRYFFLNGFCGFYVFSEFVQTLQIVFNTSPGVHGLEMEADILARRDRGDGAVRMPRLCSQINFSNFPSSGFTGKLRINTVANN